MSNLEVVFNELTFEPLASNKHDAFERVENFLKTMKDSNVGLVRVDGNFFTTHISSEVTLMDYLNGSGVKKTNKAIILAKCRHKYIDDNSQEEEEYVNKEVYLLRDDKEIKTVGLAAAHRYKTVGIGFCSEDYWDNVVHKIKIVYNNGSTKCYSIIHIANPQHANTTEFCEWKTDRIPIKLIECDDNPVDKKLNLRDDHGKDKLTDFANRLLKSKYVKSVINSLPHNSNCTKFIKKIQDDGKIEIVLPRTDRGLGLVIQTTGRNNRETEEIGKKLEKDYNIN